MWNTYRFFQKFKEEERVKMENFSAAQIELSKTQDINGNISEFPLKIIQSNTTTPMIIVDSKGFFQSNNIDLEGKNSQQYLQKLSEKFAKENPPLEVVYDGEVLSTLYYGNSILLNKLKYYPMALVLIILQIISTSVLLEVQIKRFMKWPPNLDLSISVKIFHLSKIGL